MRWVIEKSLFTILAFFTVSAAFAAAYTAIEDELLSFIVALILSLLILAACCSIALKQKATTALSVFLFLGLAVRWICVVFIQPEITSDWQAMHTAAALIASGDFKTLQAIPYFDVNVYQLGYSGYMAIYHLFLDSPVMTIKMVNTLYSAVTAFLIYMIGKSVFDEKTGVIAAALFLFYVGGVIYGSVLTNEHIAIMFFCAGFYVICEYGFDLKPVAMAGLMIGLGNLFRPVGPIAVLAFTCYAAIYCWGKGTAHFWRVVGSIAALLMGYKAVFYAASFAFQHIGITDHMLVNRDPYWKFVLGFNADSIGQWSKSDNALINTMPLNDERVEIEKNLIADRTDDLMAVIMLMIRKFIKMWGDYSMTTFWAFIGRDDLAGIKRFIEGIELAQYFAIMCMAGIGVARLRFSKKAVVFITLICLGYFSVHLLIEINTRYRYYLMPLLCILSAHGIKGLSELMKRARFNYEFSRIYKYNK